MYRMAESLPSAELKLLLVDSIPPFGVGLAELESNPRFRPICFKILLSEYNADDLVATNPRKAMVFSRRMLSS